MQQCHRHPAAPWISAAKMDVYWPWQFCQKFENISADMFRVRVKPVVEQVLWVLRGKLHYFNAIWQREYWRCC